jgi:hypothetical protein
MTAMQQIAINGQAFTFGIRQLRAGLNGSALLLSGWGLSLFSRTIPNARAAAVVIEEGDTRALELGDASVAANLWPEPFSGPENAREKDALENWLHSLVCAGQLDLVEAQRAIAEDWIGTYRSFMGGDP